MKLLLCERGNFLEDPLAGSLDSLPDGCTETRELLFGALGVPSVARELLDLIWDHVGNVLSKAASRTAG